MFEVTLVEQNFVADWNRNKTECLEAAKLFPAIASDDDLDRAGEIQTNISKLIKKLETERKAITSPLDEAKKKIMAEEKRLVKPLADELDRLKKITSAYATECARRIEEERRQAELAERRAAEAAVAAEDADPFGFNAPATPPPAMSIPQVSSMPKTSCNRMVERWDFEVLDANAVPKELCSPDPAKIRAFLASRKAEGYKADQVMVNGLKIFSTVQVQSR
jgi:hypothetical protein